MFDALRGSFFFFSTSTLLNVEPHENHMGAVLL